MTDLRAAAEMALEELTQIKYGLERNRVWGGMEWSYVPIHPTQYLPLRDKLEAQIAALRQALDQLPDTTKMIDTGIDRGAWDDVPDATKWVDDLRGDEDLEEPPNSTTDVVEPVAWIVPDYGFLFPNEDSAQRYLDNTESGAKPTPLYTAPPQREWVGLTDEDYKALEIETLVSNMGYREVLRWADKRLKEKNHVD